MTEGRAALRSGWPRPGARVPRTLVLAGAHLSTPLTLTGLEGLSDWEATKSWLKRSLPLDERFELCCDDDLDWETKCPLGSPLVFRHLTFETDLPWCPAMVSHSSTEAQPQARCDHRILIFPSGALLLVAWFDFVPGPHRDALLAFCSSLEDAIDEKEPELGFFLAETAAALSGTLVEALGDAVKNAAYWEASLAFESASAIRHSLTAEAGLAEVLAAPENLSHRQRLQSFHCDTYYVTYSPSPEDSHAANPWDVDYVRSMIRRDDYHLTELQILMYAVFLSLMWLYRETASDCNRFHRKLMAKEGTGNREIFLLKARKMLCVRLLAESEPMQIRIEDGYVAFLSEFRRKEKINEMGDGVRRLLDDVEMFVQWHHELIKRTRDMQIGIVAVAISVLTLMSVAADLISVLDVEHSTGFVERLLFLAAGVAAGASGVLAILRFPIGRGPRRRKTGAVSCKPCGKR